MCLKFFGIFLISVIVSSECSKILLIHPTFSRSHVIPLQALAKLLALRGHNITFVSLYPFDKKIENYRDIKVETSKEDKKLFDEIGKTMSDRKSPFKLVSIASKATYKIGNETLHSERMRQLMDNETFDLVVIGYFFNEFLLGLADHFKCPSILLFSGSFYSTLNRIIGNPLLPEAIPHPVINGNKLTFLMRVFNLLLNAADIFFTNFYFSPESRDIYK